ncbi:MAG: dethiobiotin synthase [Bdellovibrionia bacterium]
MKKGIFVTGTDTDIGKTFVSSLLVSSLKANGRTAGYFKPVQTGTETYFADSQTVASLSTLSPEEQTSSVYCYPQPMAPSRAASLNGEEIRLDRILQHWNALAPRTWIVEGAGGLLVPLNSTQTMRDLIVALDLNTVLVTSTRLGTINHTLLTLEAAAAQGINISGLVLVGLPDPGLEESLRDFTAAPILAQIPWLPEITSSAVKTSCSHYFPAATLNQILGPVTK